MRAVPIPILIIAIVLFSLVCGEVDAAPFTAVYVLGDSLSDSGNVAILTAPSVQDVPFGGLIPSLMLVQNLLP